MNLVKGYIVKINVRFSPPTLDKPSEEWYHAAQWPI